MTTDVLQPVVWEGCYEGNWDDLIIPAAFAHPAKFSRGLISRIYDYALAQHFLSPGDIVLDPFGGVGLGGLDAMSRGLHWIGCELEPRFFRMATGYDCQGFNSESHDGLCPDCQGKIKKEAFDDKATVANSLPEPHRFQGNFDLWRRWLDWERLPGPRGSVAMANGDSRRLAEVLAQGQYGGLETSPPYADCLDNRVPDNPACERLSESSEKKLSKSDLASRSYGAALGQLGAMQPGNVDSILSSPPYADCLTRDEDAAQNSHGRTGGRLHPRQYGHVDGQLGEMPPGDVAIVLSSPPYAGSNQDYAAGLKFVDMSMHPGSITEGSSLPKAKYGETEGQLANMAIGAVVSSPPFSGTVAQRNDALSSDFVKEHNRRYGKSHITNCNNILADGYGHAAGQLGALPTGDVAAVLASPPFGDQSTQSGGNSPARDGICSDGSKRGGKVNYQYGSANGQLANMAPDALVSSPPWQNQEPSHAQGSGFCVAKTVADRSFVEASYGQSPGQIGNAVGNTFWSAARLILLQCQAILRPGGYAIFVLKSYVKDKKIVDFPGQWERLCNACGFATVSVIHASLVKETYTNTLFDGQVSKRTKKSSFFRRLYESKNPHNAIDFEIVLVTRKIT